MLEISQGRRVCVRVTVRCSSPWHNTHARGCLAQSCFFHHPDETAQNIDIHTNVDPSGPSIGEADLDLAWH